jgi:hypothetical protein
MLIRLMYASRFAEPLERDALAALFKQASAHNPSLGVTGVLCHTGDTFLQVLEGGRAAVSRLYNRIAQDPRHREVTLLSLEEVAERRFAGWAMGQADISRLNPGLVLKFSESTVLDPFTASAKVSLAIVDELVATASIVCQARGNAVHAHTPGASDA